MRYFCCLKVYLTERNNRVSSDRLVIHSSKMCIPSDFQSFLNNNSNKERLFEIKKHYCVIIVQVMTNMYFAWVSSNKLLLRCYGDDILTVNHKDTDRKLICLVKHEHKEVSEDATSIARSTSWDIDVPVIFLNAETSSSNVFIDNGRRNNLKLLGINATTLTTGQKKVIVWFCTFAGTEQNSFEKVK